MRAIDSLRDAEQHWLIIVDEQILFMHARALATVIDEVLKRLPRSKALRSGSYPLMIQAKQLPFASSTFRKKYHLSRTELADALKLTAPKAAALRTYLKLDEDPDCMHVFTHGKSKFPTYSDNAVRRMKGAQSDCSESTDTT